MRPWMLTLAACAVGCLHPQAPTRPYDPETRATFARLVNDPMAIGQAAAYAKSRGLPPETVRGLASDAWRNFMKVGVYDAAGEVAWRFDLDPMLIGQALDFARKEAQSRVAVFIERRYEDGDEDRQAKAEWALGVETRIACRYGPAPESATLAIADVTAFGDEVSGTHAIYALLEEGCPVTSEQRDTIIDAAASEGRDAWAIHQASHADWTLEKRSEFVSGYFWQVDCADGFLAVESLKPPPDDVARFIESKSQPCEVKPLLEGRKLPRADASKYFFAAVRNEDFHLAHALLSLAALGDDGMAYLLQELARDGWEFQFEAFLKLHPDLRDRAFEAALAMGKVRLVGHLADKPAMVRRAFDKALELGRHLDALLIAENGIDEDLKKVAPRLVFDAAMKGSDYEVAVFVDGRYPDLLSKEERYEAKVRWNELRRQRKALEPPKKRKRAKPRCDDWTVTNRDACE